MSFSALYEYRHGEFQDVTRVMLNAAGVDSVWIVDPNGVKIAGHTIELWDAEPGGTQLLEDVDYSLTFLDTGKTAAEGVDIWAGYQVLNVAYQGIPLYITARIIGGYTQYSSGRIIFDEAVGDQWVTKWDTGRMELSASTTQSFAMTAGLGALFTNDYNDNIFTYEELFASITSKTINVTGGSVSTANVYTIANTDIDKDVLVGLSAINTTETLTVSFLIIGRWK